MHVTEDDVGRIFREVFGRAVAGLIRLFGDIDVAEDAVQDAFAAALKAWPRDGAPANPEAWIAQTARHRAIDRLRRESLGRAVLGDVVRDRVQIAEDTQFGIDPMDDDQLRLIFTCCHPALGQEAQVALTLRLLCGLTTRDVARAFIVEESTMAQRIVRAKRKIKEAHIPYRIPGDDELPARLPPVLATCYLVYNAGSGRSPAARDGNLDLSAEAIRLARLLGALRPDVPEVQGLLSLLLLSESRRAARTAADGSLVLLRDQARDTWDRSLIDEGQSILRNCIERDEAGPYQIQAAIQAVHADAATIERTDWPQIVALYDQLLHMTRTPVVALNRAIAVGEVDGPSAALDLVDGLALEGYYAFHATRADLLARLGRAAASGEAYSKAAALAPTEREEAFLRARSRRGPD